MIGSIVLFFLATNVQAGWLYVLSALLLGTLVAGWAIPIGGLRGLEVERHAPDRLHQGGEALVEVTVANRGRGTRRGVIVRDPHLEATDLWLGRVGAGERVSITTVRTATRRGLHAGEGAQLRSSAPFGVAERRRSLEIPTATLVLPTVIPLHHLPFVEPATTTDHAIHSAPRRGHGPEYLGIREYRSGDSMRHVHWPSTARTGSVMVREFEQEQTRRLAVVVDTSYDDGASWTPLDRACCVAASIVSAARAHGNGARLVTPADAHGRDPVSDVPDILSRAGEEEILERLALLRPSGVPFRAMLTSLDGSPQLRGVETAVLVFPTWRENDAEAVPPAIELLADRIANVVAVPVVVSSKASRRRVLDEASMAGLVQRLRALGAQVHPWRSDHDLADALAERSLAR